MAIKRQPRLMDGQDTATFRRSRTLTGSTSSGVVAANEKRGALQSDRLKKQALRHHQRLLIAGLAALAILIGGLYYTLSQYVGSVSLSYPASEKLVQQPRTSQYAKAILDYLGTRPAERFRFTLNTAELSRAVAQRYPEVAAVTTKGGSIGHGDFVITFRQPIVSWKIAQKQYYVDSDGEAFEKNMYPSPPVNVRDNSGASSGQAALASKGFLHFLGRLIALTSQAGLTVTEASLPPGTTRQVDIKLEGRGYLVKTHTDRDPAAIVQDLQRVTSYLDQRHLNPSYIDIRVPGRAYYK